MSDFSWIWRALTDLVALTVSGIMLIVYHLYLHYKQRRHPTYTIQQLNRLTRAAWVQNIMENMQKDIMGVQTLRNSTMASTFLASTAVLLIMGTLTLSGQGDKLDTTWHSLNVIGSSARELFLFKLLLLIIDFFVAFFSFSMSIRYYNHVGYMISIPEALRPKTLTPVRVAQHLNRAGQFNSIGMRAFYFAVPLVFWLFGPQFLFAATIGLIIVLYKLDREK